MFFFSKLEHDRLKAMPDQILYSALALAHSDLTHMLQDRWPDCKGKLKREKKNILLDFYAD